MTRPTPPPTPAFSVLICSHNRRKLLEEALRSVYAQTLQPLEVIVVDDGSTDGTAAWLRRARRPRLRVRLDRVNRGPAAARGRALAMSRGTFVAFLDSDDVWKPRYLETMARALGRADVMVAACNADRIDARGRKLAGRAIEPRRVGHRAFLAASGWGFVPFPSACVLRREAAERVGLIDTGFRYYYDDADLMYRIALRFGPSAFRFLDRPLVRIRRHGAQLTSYFPAREGAAFIEETLARWHALPQRDREFFFDWIRFHRKHKPWVDLVLGGQRC